MAKTSKKSIKKMERRPSSKTYFDFLSDEIICKIFSHVPIAKLYPLAGVSPRFARCYGDERFWRKVSVRHEVMHYREFEELIAGPHPPIDELDMTGCTILGSHLRLRNIKLQVTVRKLNITDVGPGRHDGPPGPVQSVLVDLCKAKELIIHRATFDPDLYDAIAENTQIEVLSVDFAKLNVHQKEEDLKPSAMLSPILHMLQSCRRLKELSMRHSTLNDHHLFALCLYASETVVKFFFNHFTCEKSPKFPSVVDHRDFVTSHLEVLFSRLVNLKHLGLAMEYLAEPRVVEEVVKLEFLESFHFCLCCIFVEWHKLPVLTQVFSKFFEEMPNLKRLYFAMECPELKNESVENVEHQLKSWCRDVLGEKMTITFTKLECVIELVDNNIE